MNSYDDEYFYEQRPVGGRNPMATAAIVLGALSIVLCSMFYVAIPCGAMAVICAILSRSRQRMPSHGKAGLICGIIGMAVSAAITVSALRFVLTTETGRAYLEYYYQIYTGDYDFDLDEALDEIFPFLYDSQEEDSGSSGENGSGAPDSGSTGDDDSGTQDSGNGGSSGEHSGESAPEQPGGSSPQQGDDDEEGGFI